MRRPSRRPRGGTVLKFAGVSVGLFGLGYLLAVYVLFPPLPVPKDGIVVPNLSGKSVDDARASLTALRLYLGDTVSLPQAQSEPGLVVAQSPLPGQQLRTGGLVSIGLSAGAPSATVPDVVGLATKRAENLLKRLGFEVVQLAEASDRPSGTVIRSEPEAGRRLPLPARVTLAVSAGQPDSTAVNADTLLRRDTIPPR